MDVRKLWFAKYIDETKWYFYETCRCGGKLTYKYRRHGNKNQKLWIYPNKQLFHILDGDNKITNAGTLENIEIVLNKTFYAQ